MARNQIKKKLKKILSTFFKKKVKFFSMETVDNWDSLNHLKVLMIIQKKFKITLNSNEIATVTDENKITKLVSEKIYKK